MSEQKEPTQPKKDEDEQRRRQIKQNQPLIALLDSWLEDESESAEEHRAALEEFMRGIDENRKGGRQLFQDLLKPT